MKTLGNIQDFITKVNFENKKVTVHTSLTDLGISKYSITTL